MSGDFTPFDQFDQDLKYPHKSSRTILDDMVDDFRGVMAVVAGVGIVVDSTDPSNPIITATPYTLPQSTSTILGGIKLGTGLLFNEDTGRVDVNFADASPVIVVTGNTTATASWHKRRIRVTANATITLPLTAVLTTTNDFNCDIQAALGSSVFIQVVDGALSLETDITGQPDIIHITGENGWVSIAVMAANIYAAVGQIEDGTP